MGFLLTEGGAAGHMWHPFDLDYAKTGQDLLDFFVDKVPAYLKDNDPHIKTDGINVSFKLISKPGLYGEAKREFAVDRGSKKAIDIEGITIDRIGERFAEGHGMRPALTDLLTILNDALDSGAIDEELKALGMWDNPDYFLNTEYVKEKDGNPVNVILYGEDFIAFHGVNEFFMKPSPKGRSISRKSREVAPTKSSSAALASFTNKIRRFSRDYNVYGPEDTKASKREGTSINFDSTLSEKVTIFTSEGTEKVDTLGGWLRNPNTKNPFKASIVLADGKEVDALSKHVYFSLILKKVPVSELLGSTDENNLQMAVDAINGAIFYHATRLLGRVVLENLYASFGGSSADQHEGIVMRSKEIFDVSRPIKITGDFIYTGAAGAISQKMAKEEPEQIEPTIERKIAVFPGAFKPPHRGHMNLVEDLIGKGVDQVIILISPLDRKTPEGKPVDRRVSEQIWQIYIDAKGLGNKVSIGDSPFNAPVTAAYEVLKGTVPDLVPQPGDLIIPAASDKPDARGIPDYYRFLPFHKGIKGMIAGVIPASIMDWYFKAPKEAPMRASDFRAALDTGEGLEAFLPTNVDPQKVLSVLGVEAQPEEPEPELPPDADAQQGVSFLETILRLTEEVIDETSSMAAGDVAGFGGSNKNKRSLIREEEPEEELEENEEVVEEVLNYLLGKGSAIMIDRKELIEEQLLRENIRKAIKLVRSRKAEQEKLEEQLLRKVVRGLILEKAPVGEDVPHEKTGINVLRRTLKKVIPQIKDDYMSLTTDKAQRDSYMAYLINGVDNILAPIETNIDAPEEATGELEEEIDIAIGNEDKFVDIGDMGLEDKEEEEVEVDDDESALAKGLEVGGLDETGRNVALGTFKQIQGAIVDDFGELANDEDRELYHDYLKTNILLWRDKFEDSLSTNLPEPTTPEYEKEKQHISGEEGMLEIIDL